MNIIKKLTSSLIATLLLFSATFSYGAQYNINNETRTLPDGSISETNFVNISTTSSNGAVFNVQNSNVTFTQPTTFLNNINSNYESKGAAIYNYAYSSDSNITFNDTVSFEENKSQSITSNTPYSYGGAIYNYAYNNNSNANITFNKQATFKNNLAQSQYTGSYSWYYSCANGGAIYNCSYYDNSNANITFKDLVTFEGNTAESINNYSDSYSYGGAIYNYSYYNNSNATITFDKQATFKNNTAKSEYTGSNGYNPRAYGGAIYNYANYSNSNATITFNDLVTFEGNTADARVLSNGSAEARGGAIYNNSSYSTITFEDGAIFRNNKAIAKAGTNYWSSAYGGAIYNSNGTINLVAKTNDVLFEGNSAQSSSNSNERRGDAIYNENGTLNLWASDDASIIFNDSVYSYSWYSDRGTHINRPNDDGRPTTGTIYLNATNNYFGGYMYVYGGTIKIGENGSFTGEGHNVYLYIQGDTTLDLANNKIQTDDFSDIRCNNNSNLYLKLDVDSQNNLSDVLSFGYGGDDVKIVIDDINIVDTTLENVKEFKVEILENDYGYDIDPIVVLSEGVKEKFHLDLPEGTLKDEEITKNTSWDKVFHVQEGYAVRDLVIDGYTLKLQTVGTWKDTEDVVGDTLNLVNTLETKSAKSFNFDSAENEYVSTDDAGETQGTLNINGVSNGDEKSTINFDSNEGFTVNEDATLNVKNTKFTGTDVAVTLNDGTLNLSNVDTQEAKLNLNGGLVKANKDKITETYYVKDLTNDTEVQIDVNPEENISDSFNVENSNAKIKITKLNTIGENGSFAVNVVEGDNVNLEVAQDIMDKYNYEIEGDREQPVTENTAWNKIFYNQTGYETSQLSVDGGTLILDVDSQWENLDVLDDTLYLVNVSSAVEDKNFIFDTADDVYVFGSVVEASSPTMVTVGKVTISGVKDGDKMSTLDLNNVGSFHVFEDELNISNTRIMNSSGTAISNSGTVNLENVVFENNNLIENCSSDRISLESILVRNGYDEWRNEETGEYESVIGTMTFSGNTLIQNNELSITNTTENKEYDDSSNNYSDWVYSRISAYDGLMVYNDYDGKMTFNGDTTIKDNTVNLTLICGNINVDTNRNSSKRIYSNPYIDMCGQIRNECEAEMTFNGKTVFENLNTNLTAIGASLTFKSKNDDCTATNTTVNIEQGGGLLTNYYESTMIFNDTSIFKNNKSQATAINSVSFYEVEVTTTSNTTYMEEDYYDTEVYSMGATVYNEYDSTMIFNKAVEFENNVSEVNVIGSTKEYKMYAKKGNSSNKRISVNIEPGIEVSQIGLFCNSNNSKLYFNDDVKFKNNSVNANATGNTIIATIDLTKLSDISLESNDITSKVNVTSCGIFANGYASAEFNKSAEFENNSMTINAVGATVDTNITGIDCSKFDIKASTVINGMGGAVANLNSGKINFAGETAFRNNSITAQATAGTISTSSGTFAGTTTVQALGGAIFNMAATTTFEDDAIFEGNSVTATITDDIELNENSSTLAAGGAIFNITMDGDSALSFDKNVKFKNNSSEFGGAVAMLVSTTTVKQNAVFKANTALSDQEGNVKFASFYGDYDEAMELPIQYGSGGAVANFGGYFEVAGSAEFEENEANYGGAIANVGYDMGEGECMEAVTTIKDGATFINNSAKELGGAIYNSSGTVNLTSVTNDILFEGNTANGESSAIYDEYGTINLKVLGNTKAIFNDKIVSKTQDSVLNINMPEDEENTASYVSEDEEESEEPRYGTIVINADMGEYVGTVNIGEATIKLGQDAQWFGGQTNVGTLTLDAINEKIQTTLVESIKVSNKLYLSLDVDFENGRMDKVEFLNFEKDTEDQVIEIKEFNVITDMPTTATEEQTTQNEMTIKFTDTEDIFEDIFTEVDQIVSEDLAEYTVTYNDDGTFTFVQTKGPQNAPKTDVTNIANVGGYAMMSNVMNQAFTTMEDQKLRGTGNNTGVDLTIEEGLWIRPFAMQETVKIGDSEIDTNSYGTVAGVDLVSGEQGLISVYAGVAGSQEKLGKMTVDQTGYVFGASAMHVEDNWYIGITGNIGTNVVTAKDNKGEDKFDMTTCSVGVKGAYDIAVSNSFSIEPGITAWYGSSTSNEYDSVREGKEVGTSLFRTIEVKPTVRFKLNLEKGFKPYATLGYAFNMGDSAEESEDRQFDEMGKDGYLEYGIGINKEFSKTVRVYLQGTGRSGGRNGVGGNAGIKVSF